MDHSYQKRALVLIVLFLIIFSSFKLGQHSNTQTTQIPKTDKTVLTEEEFAPFWKAWKVLNEKYVAATTTPNEEKVWGAIKGLVEAEGDPYTVFFPPEEAKEFADDISGVFEGVGMEVGIKDDILTVVAPVKDSPAFKAGIITGDKILKINSTSTANVSVDQAVKMIRGPKGTKVTLTILREGKTVAQEIAIIRDVIQSPTIETETKNSDGTVATEGNSGLRKDGIFVIRLFSFTATSPDLFRKALRDFVKSGSHKLVLDLRGNPGGYLEASWDIASWFLPAGELVVSEDFGKNAPPKVYRSKGYDVFNENLKMIILVDGGSASASEILAGALREHGIAKLVGTKTFGKGSVQELVQITPETSLKVTIARWMTPNGVNISQNGLVPDYEVKITETDIKAKKDPQLDKAIEILKALP